MKIYVLTEGGRKYGFGHIVRSFAVWENFKEKGFEFVFYKVLFWNLDGVLPVGKHAYLVEPHHNLLPLVVVRDKVGALQEVDPVYDDVNGRDKDGHMIFGEPELCFIKPGKKYNRQNDQ